jgi:hypothetical protein
MRECRVQALRNGREAASDLAAFSAGSVSRKLSAPNERQILFPISPSPSELLCPAR